MRTIEIGTEVIHAQHTSTFLYGGPDESGRRGWTSIRVTLGGGAKATIICDTDQVAPADAVQLNPADERYRIEKLPRKRYAWDAGPWWAHVDLPVGSLRSASLIARARPRAPRESRSGPPIVSRRVTHSCRLCQAVDASTCPGPITWHRGLSHRCPSSGTCSRASTP